MRILLIGASQLSVPDSMEKHIYETLGEMGHLVEHLNARDISNISPIVDRVFQFVARNTLREPERLNEKKILNAVSRFQPDFILVVLGSMLSPKTMKEIRKIYSGKIVCWCQDQMTTLGRQYLIGGDYDMVFVKDHYLVDMFSSYLGMNVRYLPEACNPKYHSMVNLNVQEKKDYACDIVTYGTLYYYRQKILESLLDYDLRVYGNCPDWLINTLGKSHMEKNIYEEEKCKVLAGATITLNSFHFGEVNGINARAFEVAGCGGFQLASYTKTIEEHFTPGAEIETFSCLAELREKVDFYLKDPEKANAIAAAGNKRAHLEHTYRHRLQELIGASNSC